MIDFVKYPLGIQSFDKLRSNAYVYVDKTEHVWRMVNFYGAMFMSRPRRFGKSLLISTLQAYFEGRSDLFEGLAIAKYEKEWKKYPVLRFDMSEAVCNQKGGLEEYLNSRLQDYADKYGIGELNWNLKTGGVFGRLIGEISEKTGERVVILIDEYDKGLLDTLGNKELFEENRNLLQPFFQQIKSQDEYLRFSFITGVSRFRHVTLFSGVNNLYDISMDSQYSTICGITEYELEKYFRKGISDLADKNELTYEKAIAELLRHYDGYRFTSATECVINPFSLVNVFIRLKFNNYWAMSGITSSLLTFMEKLHISIAELTCNWYSEDQLSQLFNRQDPASLFFQTGYLTIGEARKNNTYRLRIPNEEVRSTLVNLLLPYNMNVDKDNIEDTLWNIKEDVQRGKVDAFMERLQSLMGKIPYQTIDNAGLEIHYHAIVYLIFMMMGLDTKSEISISGGRIDMVCSTEDFVYVFEFKLDGTAKEALRQINEKGYAISWNAGHRKIIKIGAVFSSKTKSLAEWKTDIQI